MLKCTPFTGDTSDESCLDRDYFLSLFSRFRTLLGGFNSFNNKTKNEVEILIRNIVTVRQCGEGFIFSVRLDEYDIQLLLMPKINEIENLRFNLEG